MRKIHVNDLVVKIQRRDRSIDIVPSSLVRFIPDDEGSPDDEPRIRYVQIIQGDDALESIDLKAPDCYGVYVEHQGRKVQEAHSWS